MVETAFAGQYRSIFKGRGMNFEEVREYQPGDEVRTIDWNVTARYGEPFVKKFTEERELTVMLLVDVSASGNFGSVELSKRELAAEVACLFAFSAIRNSDKVGLILFSDHVELFIAPKKGAPIPIFAIFGPKAGLDRDTLRYRIVRASPSVVFVWLPDPSFQNFPSRPELI
jgi:uncharacterized protein (DUF58 family)